MKKVGLVLLMGTLLSAPASLLAGDKNDYPTDMRVKYVLDCMDRNATLNRYESVHKCSCVIDKISAKLTQREFDDGAVTFELKNMPADRGAMFRDNDDAQNSMVTLKEVQASAYDQCNLKR